MLYVEKLECKNKKFHTGECIWKRIDSVYNDTSFNYLVIKANKLVQETGTAFRIVHHYLGVLYTIKLGHDKNLFISKDKRSIVKMFNQSRRLRLARAR